MDVLNIYGDIGSMVIGAKEQGWNVIGNIEDRPYFYTGTFEKNFPGAFMVKSVNELTSEQYEMCKNVDLIIGHPSCSSFSRFRKNSETKEIDKKKLSNNIRYFVHLVKEFQPKFFAFDNLPVSLEYVNYEFYHDMLPDYDIYFEWINNYGYGNVQKNRKRLFVIGAKKELKYVFIPGEFEHNETVIDRLNKIKTEKNNYPWKDEDFVLGWRKHEIDEKYFGLKGKEDNITFAEFREYLKKQPLGVLQCYNLKRKITKRIGKCLVDVNEPSKTITGGGNNGFHYFFRNDTYKPFTIRERAKIQGCPDSFEFVPDIKPQNCKSYSNLVLQTGRFMPVEFCTYLTQQFKDVLTGNYKPENYTKKRVVNQNDIIVENKIDYCTKYGYSDQQNACLFCGAKKECDKIKKQNNELKFDF